MSRNVASLFAWLRDTVFHEPPSCLACEFVNPCFALNFQFWSLGMLILASLVLCAFENGKMSPKRSSTGKVMAIFT